MFVLMVQDPPRKEYIFGRLGRFAIRQWDSPAVFDNEPAHVTDALVRWNAKAGYVAYGDPPRALYGLASRGLVKLDRYQEAPKLPEDALAGIQVIPKDAGDILHLWAPVQDEPDVETGRTGHLWVSVDPALDFERLMNAFIKEDPRGDILNAFMLGGGYRGRPPTPEETAEIEKILALARR